MKKKITYEELNKKIREFILNDIELNIESTKLMQYMFNKKFDYNHIAIIISLFSIILVTNLAWWALLISLGVSC